MPRSVVARYSMITMAALALSCAAGGAGAHPGTPDSVDQTPICPTGLSGHSELRHAPSATGQIDAVLLAASTRRPIAGGQIVLTGHDTCGDTIHRHLATDTSGRVSFRGLQPGHYTLTAYPSDSATHALATVEVELSVPARKILRFTVAAGRD
ncbi:carboxypeptidase-like regulatory domain-containing protein [Nocardia rhizosphaerae]|uniref:Carboxypeptidase-like regulatory domain-containing protein n=1 Tax=Nocardia rhizosphaerae TaxID=1691571 RepID=A0ABV8L8I9_9NOCA